MTAYSSLALLFLASLAPSVAAHVQPLTAEQASAMVAETPQISEVALAPDGKWATYAVTRRSVERNSRQTQRYLQRIPREGEPPEPAQPLDIPQEAVGIAWRPGSKDLCMILGGASYNFGREAPHDDARFVCRDIETGIIAPVPTFGRAVTVNYKWSPKGNYLAFVAPLAERAPLDPRRGVPHGLVPPGRFMALHVLDVRTGQVVQLTPDSVNVARAPQGSFSWSPDERAVAITVSSQMEPEGMYESAIAVVDLAHRRMRTLVARPGMNAAPCWSPDGRSIAFSTHQGQVAYRTGWPALVPAKGGDVADFPRQSPMGFHGCRWSSDSGSFQYVSATEMTLRHVRADAASRTTTVLPQATAAAWALEDNRSFSADGRRMAFTVESIAAPAELFVVALDASGRPVGTPTQLTRLTQDFALGRRVDVEALSWPSPDGKFTIHGLLLKPAGVQERLPTLLYIVGGPSMVQRGFAQDGWSGASLPLAARGFAVLIPNTRGRGGYGAEFNDAIGTDRSRGRLPLADALAGLDLLIDRGVVDPERTGMLGHSYGAYLTAYAVTQTQRFKAAVLHDGSYFGSLADYTSTPASSWRRLLWRDLFGVHDPFDPEDRKRILSENMPGFHADRITTPTMLLAATRNGPLPPYGGVYPNAMRESGPFYHALRRADTPAALFVYDEPHVWQRPAAIADDLTRTAEWLDYWVRGMAFPSSSRAGEYGVVASQGARTGEPGFHGGAIP